MYSGWKNKIHRYAAISIFIFTLGVVKESIKYDFLPWIYSTFNMTGFEQYFVIIDSISIWLLYSFAMPMMVLAGFYFSNYNETHEKQFQISICAIFTISIILTFVFIPTNFRYYQDNNLTFWFVYTIYNYILGFVFLLRSGYVGIKNEFNLSVKTEKKKIAFILFPVVYGWLFFLFIPNMLRFTNLSIEEQFLIDFWQYNLYVLIASLFAFVMLSLRYGFMGLKLVTIKYNWSTNMEIASLGAEISHHMLKQNIEGIAADLKQLKNCISSNDNKNNENLSNEILGNLQDYVKDTQNLLERFRKHTKSISLKEDRHSLLDLLNLATNRALQINDCRETFKIEITSSIKTNTFLECDREHMVEVFINFFINAMEATKNHGTIKVRSRRDSFKYELLFEDDGEGIAFFNRTNIFEPHFTTKKNSDKNFGLGLYYCKNVILAHKGAIFARSESGNGNGTTIHVHFPLSKIS